MCPLQGVVLSSSQLTVSVAAVCVVIVTSATCSARNANPKRIDIAACNERRFDHERGLLEVQRDLYPEQELFADYGVDITMDSHRTIIEVEVPAIWAVPCQCGESAICGRACQFASSSNTLLHKYYSSSRRKRNRSSDHTMSQTQLRNGRCITFLVIARANWRHLPIGPN